MSKQNGAVKWNRPDHERTNEAMKEALHDIRSAVRPRVHSIRDGVSWVVALAAGTAVLWRSFQAARELPEGFDNKTATQFQAAMEHQHRIPDLQSDKSIQNKNGKQSSAIKEAQSKKKPETDAANPESAGARVEHGFVPLAKEFYKRFTEDEITTRASALAFVGTFSLIPVALFALIALGFIFRDPQAAAQQVQNIVTQLLPGESAQRAAKDVLQQTHLVETAQNMTRGAALPVLIGVVSLLWAGLSLFATATVPMNAAWDTKETRSLPKLYLTAFSVLVGAGFLFVASLGLSALPGIIHSLKLGLFGALGEVPFWGSAFFVLGSLLLGMAMFVLIYRFLPDAPVTWRAALFGGVITGLLWTAFKEGFGLYLAHFGNSNNKLYGALGGIVLLITWIYYSCVVLLSGAELCKMYHEHKEEGGVTKREAA